MTLSPSEAAAVDRLANKYRTGDYHPTGNAGGFGNNGHAINFPAAVNDIGIALAAAAREATAAAAAAAAAGGSAASAAASAVGTGTVDAALAAKQPLAALLTAIASLATAAGKGLYFAGIGAPATYDLSSFVRGLSGVGDAAGLRTAIAAAGTEGPEISSPLTVKSGTYPEIRIATTVDGTPDQRAFKIIIDHPRRLLAIQATSDFGSYIRNIIQFGHDGQISAAGDISISKPPGTNRSFSIYSDGIPRWSVSANSGSEGGGNTGSDFGINRFSDNGDYLGTSMFIDRGTGLITMSGGLTSDGPVRYRVYTRGTLPTPAAFTVGWAQVSNPESGKSLFVYCNGTAWVYIDGSAVTIA